MPEPRPPAPQGPRSPVRLRLYAWVTGLVLGSLDAILALRIAVGPDAGGPWTTSPLAVVLLMCGSAAVGSAAGAPILRRLGVRMAGVGADLLLIAGALLAVLPGARIDAALALGVALAGLGSGLLLLVAPQVCHELSLPGHRRLMPQAIALVPVGAALGVMGSWWLARSLTAGWLGVVAVALAHLGVVLVLPPSPVWLTGRGRDIEAFAALRGLHGTLEAAVAIDWARHEAGMAAEQQPLTLADLRVRGIRRAAGAAAVLVIAQEAPLGAAAIILAPAIVLILGGSGAQVAVSAVGWLLIAALALLLGGTATRRRFIAVMLGVSLAVIASTLLVALTAVSGRAALWLAVIPLVVVAGAQHALVLPACQGAVDPRVPPWLVGAQRRMVAVGRSVVRIPALAIPLAVLERGGPGVMAWVFFALAVASVVVVMARLPRELGAP
ncbi:MFS transporter [Actinomyces bowdenii]|uniref:MFS transporter n=1 Tax=Actinomyces bowdenii TaxID=131109 RepID=UPI001FD4034C|nr:MFS transporter [Actinomyces bowdenii]